MGSDREELISGPAIASRQETIQEKMDIPCSTGIDETHSGTRTWMRIVRRRAEMTSIKRIGVSS